MIYGRRCHILHVTDNDPDHRLLEERIEENSALILEHSRTSGEALKRLRSSPQAERPNLIMIDWALPGLLTGDELLTTLKTDLSLRSIPIIVFTSTVKPGEIDKIYGLGVSCVIYRALELDEFANAIELIYTFWGSIASLPFCDPQRPATA